MTYENVTVLRTGAAGLLGTWLRRTEPAELDVIPATHRRRVSATDVVADLRDRDAVASALTTVRPGLVIHAGYARAPTVWFCDEMRQPAYAEELCRAIWDIASVPLEQRAGVWHLPGPERLSRYEIADRAVAALGLHRSSIVSAVTPLEAHRPRDLNLTGARAKAQIGWCPTPIHVSTAAST